MTDTTHLHRVHLHLTADAEAACSTCTPTPQAVTPEAVAADGDRLTAMDKLQLWVHCDLFGPPDIDDATEITEAFDALAADLAAQTARADAAERERDELVAALDTLESDAGITANGNMWRFWAQMARDEAKQAKASNAARKAAEAKVAKLVAALIQAKHDFLYGDYRENADHAQKIDAIVAEVQG